MKQPEQKRPAGRPKSEEKTSAILCAASRLFLEQGLQGTSMDAVARAAGVSKQTVYSHFAGKEALFRACIRAKIAEHGFGEKPPTDGGDPREILIALARRFMRLIFDPEVIAMHRVVMSESASQPRISELFFESGPAATKEAVAALLERMIADGALRPHDTLYSSWQLVNMAFGSFHIRLLFNLIQEVPEQDLTGHLERTVDDFLVLYGAGAKDQ